MVLLPWDQVASAMKTPKSHTTNNNGVPERHFLCLWSMDYGCESQRGSADWRRP